MPANKGHRYCGRVMAAKLSERDFLRLAEFIHSECGIRMPDSKKVVLETRLRRRLRVLGMDSYARYCDYVFSPEGTERELFHMIDTVTTNKTDFFREPRHFEYLTGTVLPEIGPGERDRDQNETDGLVRWMLHRGRTLHPGDGTERFCRGMARVSFHGPRNGHFHPGTQ